MRITIRCPHCRARAVARTSKELSLTMREITYTCTDPECGCSYVSTLEVVRLLTVSAKSRTNVRIPLAPRVKERIQEQLDLIG